MDKIVKEKIESCRAAALNALKPDRKTLEHGLELHRHALVVDAYGFGPWGPYDNDTMNILIEAGASSDELTDAKDQMLSIGFYHDPEAVRTYQGVWEAAGMDSIFLSAGEPSESAAIMLKRFARFTYISDFRRDFFKRAVIPEDIEQAKRENLKTFYMSVNAVPIDKLANNVKEMLLYIETMFQLGCRMMHMTYNRRNLLGDGCGEETDCGLSAMGKSAIDEMNRVGVIPDVAHSGQKTSFETARYSRKPVVASHSGCMALNSHCRNKHDDVIREIAKSGGYIGICCMARFLGRSENINALLDHIDYVVENFGIDHVAIGSDKAFYTSENVPRGVIKCRESFESLWPPDSTDPVRRDEWKDTMAWPNWPIFTVGLVQRGYSDDDIRKIIGENVLRVAKKSLDQTAIHNPAQNKSTIR